MASKNSGSGPEAAVRWKSDDPQIELYWELELPTVINQEREDYNPVGQDEIDEAVRTWLNVYHSLVWLVAAMDPPERNNINADYVDFTGTVQMNGEFILEDSHRVPAFYEREAGATGRSGWIYETLSRDFKTLSEHLDVFGRDFVEKLLQQVEIEDGDLQPILQYFLDKFKNLPSGFELERCIKTSRASIPKIKGFHNSTNQYVGEALDLISQIWQEGLGRISQPGEESLLWEERLKRHLDQMCGWVKPPNPDQVAGSGTWLKEELQLGALEDQIHDLFDSNNQNIRENLEVVSNKTIVLHINTTTFELIFGRFVDQDGDETSKGLEKTISHLVEESENLSDTEKTEWKNLLWVTYGAVAWQIFQQAKRAVERVSQIF
jgi:hypothetical protein